MPASLAARDGRPRAYAPCTVLCVNELHKWAVLDEAGERLLLLRRHRFIVDRWVWELPGGYVDEGEDPAAAAAREVVEETGWQPRGVEFVISCQPLIGNADFPQDLFLAHGADQVGEPEADEAAEVKWYPSRRCPR
jgi:8-oxo-dGTP pyrophosphatase MutT (NUDIX family)